jgi:hypothetical protein
VWEHHADVTSAGESKLGFAVATIGRTLRGVPADILWRVNVEGPQLDIRIPFERIMGALLLGLVVMLPISGAISGYDTGREAFPDELRRLAGNSELSDNVNMVARAVTGVGLLAGAAALYATLRERGQVLSAMIGLGIAAAGVLTLVAGALQLVFVEMAEEYVASTGARQEQLEVTGRAVALAVENVTFGSMITLALSVWVLAAFTARESLVPRWLVGIPALGAGLIAVSLVLALGARLDDARWMFLMSGLTSSLLWLLIAGVWLIFAPSTKQAPSVAPAAA